MYPIKLGYSEAIRRIKSLIRNGHYAEALVTSVFTVEKTLRRTLRQLIVSAGFISRHADKIVKKFSGLESIKDNWELYDPEHRKLTTILNQKDWQIIFDAYKKRNDLVHGNRVYNLELCHKLSKQVLDSLDNIKKTLDDNYRYSGWTRGKMRRKSKLHQDSKK